MNTPDRIDESAIVESVIYDDFSLVIEDELWPEEPFEDVNSDGSFVRIPLFGDFVIYNELGAKIVSNEQSDSHEQ